VSRRLAFLGTPDAAVASLRALVAAGHDVAIVITRPDRRRGRGSATSASPVKVAAEELGLPVSHTLADIVEANVELGVVVAYGAMVPASMLESVPMLNVHFSLLPRWRGAAPVERAIMAGDEVTGVCVMGLEATLDTGPVYARASVPIDDSTAPALTSQLAEIGANLLVDVLSHEPLNDPEPQSGEATYAAKLGAEEFLLTPERPVDELARLVRVGRAYTFVAGRRVRVLEAALGDGDTPVGHLARRGEAVAFGASGGELIAVTLQPEGSRAMSATSWWAGARLDASATWGASDTALP
jgi:methionyl-tRNA formyltransferase